MVELLVNATSRIDREVVTQKSYDLITLGVTTFENLIPLADAEKSKFSNFTNRIELPIFLFLFIHCRN